MLSIATFCPDDFDLPEKFTSFRGSQIEAVDLVLNTPKRFTGVCLPTGSGKTLFAAALAKASGMRAVIVTSTKGLQQQYLSDFGNSGLVDIRGKANYDCAYFSDLNCKQGPHEGCKLIKGAGCSYENARDNARASQLVLTNYSYWISINTRVRGLEPPIDDAPDPVELLILDEGHKAMEELGKSMRVTLREQHLKAAKLVDYPKSDNLQDWLGYAADELTGVDEQLKNSIENLQHNTNKVKAITLRTRVYMLEELVNSLSAIKSMNNDNWVLEMRLGSNWGRLWDFDCIWPGMAAENRLFLGVPKVVIMSATLRPVSMGMLGIKREEYEFREWEKVFPSQNTPVYHVPTVRMKFSNTDVEKQKWVDSIDEIISTRLDRKGIIHTVSYDRQKFLQSHSKFSQHMVINTVEADSPSAGEVLERFKQMDAPAVLVSPSFSTGWDFPDETCRWQIISKLAFPGKSKVMEARQERNEKYVPYLVMQDLVQACGRGTRHEKDWCECVSPDTRILTADLNWKAAGAFEVGDTLLAFDEMAGNGRANPRRWRWSTVEKHLVRSAPRVKVFYDGGSMVTTPDHLWLTINDVDRTIQWTRSDRLRAGTKLFRLLDVWDSPTSFNAGWLSGFCDGEGCLSLRQGTRNPNVTGISITQNPGLCLETGKQIMSELSFDYNMDVRDGRKAQHIKLLGGHPEILRFLGSVRPNRLLAKFRRSERNERLTALSYPVVQVVEPYRSGLVVAMQTSTGTYIAEGMGAHNCFIVDDGIGWFLNQHRMLAPKGFDVRRVSSVPAPMRAR